MTMLFGVGALIGFAGTFWQGSAKSLRFWFPGAVALTLAPFMTLSPSFLWLLLIPSLSMAVAFWFKKIIGRILIVYVVADLCTALAVTIHQRASTGWWLPEPGAWESGAPLIAAAALLRLGSPIIDVQRSSRGLVLLGWWQGALLGWLAGRSAAPILISGGACLLLAYILLRKDSRPSPLLVFGVIIAVVAASGSSALAVTAVGLAGSAFLLGERGASVWAAVLSLSVPATLIWSQGDVSSLPIIVGTPLAAMAVYGLAREAPGQGGALAAITAVALSVAALPDKTLRWLLYGVATAGMVTLSLTRPRSVAPSPLPAEPFDSDRTRPMTWALAILLLPSVFLAARLTLVGLSTGFL